MQKLSIKSWLSDNILSESTAPNMSPDNIGTISSFVIKPNKGSLIINFTTKDEKPLKLVTKDTMFYRWIKEKAKGEENQAKGFLHWFLKGSKPTDGKMISEIIDDYNNLIGDDDLPADIDNRMIGLSATDSDVATYQTRAKPLKNFQSWGLGYISW